jgi:hypothetical protein
MTTKTELEAQVAQLQEQLAAAQSATPDSAPRLPGFADRVWLPGDIDEVVTNQDGTTWKPVKYGTTKNGSRFFEWKTSVSHLDKKTNKRIYSKTRIPFKAQDFSHQPCPSPGGAFLVHQHNGATNYLSTCSPN